jgi:hypothetical protein
MRACSGCLRQRQCRPAPTPAAAAATTDLPWHGLQRTRDACFAKPLTPTLVPPSTAHIHPSRSPSTRITTITTTITGHSLQGTPLTSAAGVSVQLFLIHKGGHLHAKIAVAGVVSTARTHQESAGQPVLGNGLAAPGLVSTPTASTGPTCRITAKHLCPDGAQGVGHWDARTHTGK